MNGIRSLALEGMRFGLVGIAATLTYALAASLSHLAGAVPALANLVGYGVATAISFLGHFHFTFGKRSGHWVHLVRFLIITGCGFLLSEAIMHLMLDRLGASFWEAIAAVVLAVPPFSWLAGRLWVFR